MNQPNRASRRLNGLPNPSGVVDLNALVQKESAEYKLSHSQCIVFPLQFIDEWLRMDGSYTLKSLGMPGGSFSRKANHASHSCSAAGFQAAKEMSSSTSNASSA